MATGRTRIIACPHCDSVALDCSVDPNRSALPTIWTDGKAEDSTRSPDSPELVRCAHCSEFYWQSDAEPKCEIDVLPTQIVINFAGERSSMTADTAELETILPAEWLNADHLRQPTVEDWQDALAEYSGQNDFKEMFLRTRYWWCVNDTVRGKPESDSAVFYRHDHYMNLCRLMRLLPGDSGEERITKAEIHRELGELNLAVDLLTNVPPLVTEAARRIRRLAMEGSTRVEVVIWTGPADATVIPGTRHGILTGSPVTPIALVTFGILDVYFFDAKKGCGPPLTKLL